MDKRTRKKTKAEGPAADWFKKRHSMIKRKAQELYERKTRLLEDDLTDWPGAGQLIEEKNRSEAV